MVDRGLTLPHQIAQRPVLQEGQVRLDPHLGQIADHRFGELTLAIGVDVELEPVR